MRIALALAVAVVCLVGVGGLLQEARGILQNKEPKGEILSRPLLQLPSTTVVMGYWQLNTSKREPGYYLQSAKRNAAELGALGAPLIFLSGSSAWCQEVELAFLSRISDEDEMPGLDRRRGERFSCRVVPFKELPGRRAAISFVAQNCSAKGNKVLGAGVLQDMATVYLSKVDLVSDLVASGAVRTEAAAWVDAGLPASYSRVLNGALSAHSPVHQGYGTSSGRMIFVNAYCTEAASRAFAFGAPPRESELRGSTISAGARAGRFLDGLLFGSEACWAAYGQPPAKAGILLGAAQAWPALRVRFGAARARAMRRAHQMGCHCVDEEAIFASMLQVPINSHFGLLDRASPTGARNPNNGCPTSASPAERAI